MESRQCFGISLHLNILHIRILDMLHLPKLKKELETPKEAVRMHSENIGMEFDTANVPC